MKTSAYSCDMFLFFWNFFLRFFRLETTDDLASWFLAGWMLPPTGCSVAVGEEGLSETVLMHAWFCFSGGTEVRAGTWGGWLDGGNKSSDGQRSHVLSGKRRKRRGTRDRTPTVYPEPSVAPPLKSKTRLLSLFRNTDLLYPSLAKERSRHKKKRLVQSPNSYFMDVKCTGCYKITTIFSHAQTVNSSTVLDSPSGFYVQLKVAVHVPGFTVEGDGHTLGFDGRATGMCVYVLFLQCGGQPLLGPVQLLLHQLDPTVQSCYITLRLGGRMVRWLGIQPSSCWHTSTLLKYH
ncbi:40S ribosomal protein S27-3 [Liparis tanakae]|uniref:40S ribosomal protein S27-3 n=1 Tax=Liparis tanakae TaxID=230148 RepID=A0A4Z2IBI0_9TELE|nr:40S ribosomal protein S27-3 [Liparis tanakae]